MRAMFDEDWVAVGERVEGSISADGLAIAERVDNAREEFVESLWRESLLSEFASGLASAGAYMRGVAERVIGTLSQVVEEWQLRRGAILTLSALSVMSPVPSVDGGVGVLLSSDLGSPSMMGLVPDETERVTSRFEQLRGWARRMCEFRGLHRQVSCALTKDEIAAEAAFEVWRREQRSDLRATKTYVYKTVARLVFKRAEAEFVEFPYEPFGRTASPESIVVKQDCLRAIRRYLREELTAQERQVLQARFYNRLSEEAAGDTVGWSRYRVQRFERKLSDNLRGQVRGLRKGEARQVWRLAVELECDAEMASSSR